MQGSQNWTARDPKPETSKAKMATGSRQSASSTFPTKTTRKVTIVPEQLSLPLPEPETRISWDDYFLGMAEYVGSRSKDPSTKVGCVLVRPDRTVVSMGYNGFPRGCDDGAALYADKPTKYRRVVHAEANAILTAREPLAGVTAYIAPLCPCASCAGLLIQAGVKRIVFRMVKVRDEWTDSFAESERMCAEAGVEFSFKVCQGG